MYCAYFGLSEAPFSIAPDPGYLFMSDRHREALAHLSHGLGDKGGFVLLTGEVGTGKTTISRSVMENLPESTQAAFILNPTLSSEELLATICDNLKIRYKKTGATLKYLTDKIHAKLINNHQENINTLLVIDEAQHLHPEVLEQLRLLTNLETNTKKLLQVILIGQPELQQLLQRRDLRQLAQRITARYHLLPLTKVELANYIQHRLGVAHCTRAIFDNRAIAALHKLSHGIPRVVNLLCDRALIIAYGKNLSVVNKKVIHQAAVEALGLDDNELNNWQKTPMKLLYASILLAVGIFSGYKFAFQQHSMSAPEPTNLSSQQLFVEEHAAFSPNNLTFDNHANPTANNEAELKLADTTTSVSDAVKQPKPIDEIVESTDEIESLTHIEKVEQEPQPIILGYQPEKALQNQSRPSIEIVAENGVSEDLLARFKAAVEDTAPQTSVDTDLLEPIQVDEHDESSYPGIHQMPAQFQQQLPRLQFDMHIYATEGQGWVRVNGEDMKEGGVIASGVSLVKIFPQHVVLSFQHQRFTMPALSTW